MSLPKSRPTAIGAHVLSTDRSTCPLGKRCHVEGKGIVRFGTRFHAGLVRRVANSAVLLVNDDGRRTGSGTLIDVGQGESRSTGQPVLAGVVLCAMHTEQSLSGQYSALVPYRLHAPNAPGGWYMEENKAAWTPPDPLAADYVRGRKTAVLERGGGEIDYALVLFEFDALSPPPRAYKPPGGSPLGRSLGDELLLVGHPYHTVWDCESTQASAGKKITERAKFEADDPTDFYAFADLDPADGTSGGGVYNTSLEIVGVLKGINSVQSKGVAFLNLGALVDAKLKGTELLQSYMAGGRYLVG